TGCAPASAVYQPPPGTKTGFRWPPLFVERGEVTASATTAASKATPARTTSRKASAGFKPPRTRARRTTHARPGRTRPSTDRQHLRTAGARREERRALGRARDRAPRPHRRYARAPRRSTRVAGRSRSSSERRVEVPARAPVRPARLRAGVPAAARPAAVAADRRAQASGGVAQEQAEPAQGSARAPG